jgi:hypothetical protein
LLENCSHLIGGQISKTPCLFICFATHSYIVWVSHGDLAKHILVICCRNKRKQLFNNKHAYGQALCHPGTLFGHLFQRLINAL